MDISVIIPSKNRSVELRRMLATIAAQTMPPHEVIIVDQSAGADEAACRALLPGIKVIYIHDPRITGLTMARNRGIRCASGGILAFVDDDELLEPDYLAELQAAYEAHPDANGVSGVVTNYQRPPLSFRLWYRISHLGPFFDVRQPLYWRAQTERFDAIPVSRLGGGVMSFRKQVFSELRFDENLSGGCFGEDVDFSARVGKLFITGKARLCHKHSASERSGDHWLQLTVRSNCYLAHSLGWKGPSYYWCMAFCWLSCAGLSLLNRSRQPLRLFYAGRDDARKDLQPKTNSSAL